jgi:glutamine amidotransferase
MIVIVDYGMGNLGSVQKAVESLGRRASITSLPSSIKKAEKIIFPGVGHFGKAVRELKRRKIYSVLKEKIDTGTSFLGICLGMQLLLEQSEEAPGIKGLGVIKGRVQMFKTKKLIVPHMGWNQIKIKDKKTIFKGVKDKSYFYFAHSYYCKPKEPVTLSTTDYGLNFASSLQKKNIWAVQFHPEKSQALGLKVLDNFLKLC